MVRILIPEGRHRDIAVGWSAVEEGGVGRVLRGEILIAVLAVGLHGICNSLRDERVRDVMIERLARLGCEVPMLRDDVVIAKAG